MTGKKTEATQSGEGRPFRKLLVACSPGESDDATFAAAADLAKAWNASVSVLVVIELPSEIDRISGAVSVSHEEIVTRMVAESQEEVLETVSRVTPGLQPTIDVKVGKPFIEIVRHVFANQIDMVVKRAEELHGIHRNLFASTDQHLLRKCPCPVWLRRPNSPPSVKTVLAAVDVHDSTASEPETLAGLNRRIIETATQIAAGAGGIVYALHAWDAPDEGFIRRWSGSPEIAEAHVKDVRLAHKSALDRLLEQARTWIGPDLARRVKLEPLLKRGAARRAIPAQTYELKADILVMGTIARTGVSGFIIGNTAEDILNSIDCSVVAVKPPNYLSPLQEDQGW